MSSIKLFAPSMGQEEIDAVAEVIRSGWIGLGPKVGKFEKEFAEYVGIPCATAVNSCTAALDLALRLLGIRQGDEVIVPALTFASTAHAVRYQGAVPVFADVRDSTLCLDLEDVARKITRRTRAIIPVHYGGRSADIETLVGMLNAHQPGIHIIEDCAHACGAQYWEGQAQRWRRVGAYRGQAFSCWSFHAVKNLSCGDGGMLTGPNAFELERAKRLSWLGIDKSTYRRTGEGYEWDYEIDEIGLKCHMNDLTAAIGLVQLRKLNEMNARRKAIAEMYTAAFCKSEVVQTPCADSCNFLSSWHLYVIRTQEEGHDERDRLFAHMKAREITCGVHYKPLHLHPVYGSGQRAHLPVAEREWQRILSLPINAEMSDGDVNRVIGTVEGFYHV